MPAAMTEIPMLRPRSSPWSHRSRRGAHAQGCPRSLAGGSVRSLMEPSTAQITRRRLEELTAEAKYEYARDRHRLCRAKVHSPRLTSPGWL